MSNGEGVVAIVQGLRDSGLAVALVKASYLQNIASQLQESRKSCTAGTSTQSDRRPGAQSNDGYNHGQKGSHSTATLPVEHLPVYPQRRVNKPIQRPLSKIPSRSSDSYVNHTDAFAHTLRQYPLPEGSVSSELLQRLLNYTQDKYLSRNNSISMRSLRNRNSNKSKDSRESTVIEESRESRESPEIRDSTEFKPRESEANLRNEFKESRRSSCRFRRNQERRYSGEEGGSYFRRAAKRTRGTNTFRDFKARKRNSVSEFRNRESREHVSGPNSEPRYSTDSKAFNNEVRNTEPAELIHTDTPKEFKQLKESKEFKGDRESNKLKVINEELKNECSCNKYVQTYTRTSKETFREAARRSRNVFRTSHIDTRCKNHLNETFDYLKAACSGRPWYTSRDQEIRYFKEVGRCFRETLQQMMDASPRVCPSMQERYSLHRKLHHGSETGSMMCPSLQRRYDEHRRQHHKDAAVDTWPSCEGKTSNVFWQLSLRASFHSRPSVLTIFDRIITYQQVSQPPVDHASTSKAPSSDSVACGSPESVQEQPNWKSSLCPCKPSSHLPTEISTEKESASFQENIDIDKETYNMARKHEIARDLATKLKNLKGRDDFDEKLVEEIAKVMGISPLEMSSAIDHYELGKTQFSDEFQYDFNQNVADQNFYSKLKEQIRSFLNTDPIFIDNTPENKATIEQIAKDLANKLKRFENHEDIDQKAKEEITKLMKTVNLELTGNKQQQNEAKQQLADTLLLVIKDVNDSTSPFYQDIKEEVRSFIDKEAIFTDTPENCIIKEKLVKDLAQKLKHIKDQDYYEEQSKNECYKLMEALPLHLFSSKKRQEDVIKVFIDNLLEKVQTTEDSSNTVDEDFKKKIQSFIDKAPIFIENTSENKKKKEQIVRELARKLKPTKYRDDFNKKSKEEITNLINSLLLELSGTKLQRDKTKQKLANTLFDILTDANDSYVEKEAKEQQHSFKDNVPIFSGAKYESEIMEEEDIDLTETNDVESFSNHDIEKMVHNFINNAPIFSDNTLENKAKKEQITKQVTNKLKSLKNRDDYDDFKINEEIKNFIKTLPFELSGTKKQQNEAKQKLADTFLENLSDVNDRTSRFNEEVKEKVQIFADQLPVFTKDNPESKAQKEQFIEELASNLKRFKGQDDFEERAKEEIGKLINNLPLELSGTKRQQDEFKKKLTDTLLDNLKEVNETTKSYTEKMEEQVRNFINKAPLLIENTSESKIKKERIVKQLVSNLKRLEGCDNYEEQAREEINKALQILPLDLSGTKRQQDEAKQKLADSFLESIKEINDPSNPFDKEFKEQIRSFIDKAPVFTEDTPENKTEKKKIVDKLFVDLKRFKGQDDYEERAKEEIYKLVKILPFELSGTQRQQDKAKREFANTMLDDLLNTKEHSIQEKVLKVDNYSNPSYPEQYGIFTEDSVVLAKKDLAIKPTMKNIVRELANKLQNLKDHDDYKSRAKEEIKTFVNSLPLEVSGNKHTQDLIKKRLADTLLENLLNIDESSKPSFTETEMRDIIKDEVVSILEDFNTSAYIKEEIQEKIVEVLADQLMRHNNDAAVETQLVSLLESCNLSDDEVKHLTAKLIEKNKDISVLHLNTPEASYIEKLEKEIFDFVKDVTRDANIHKTKAKKPHVPSQSASWVEPEERDTAQITTQDKRDKSAKVKSIKPTIDFKTSTPIKKNASIPKRLSSDISAIHFDVDNKRQMLLDNETHKLFDAIKSWMDKINVDMSVPNKEDFKNKISENIATDVIDRNKYATANTSAFYSEKDELEHLKYIIFRWLNEVVPANNMTEILSKVSSLMNNIKAIHDINQMSQQTLVIQQDSSQFIAENLEGAIRDWLKQQYFFKNTKLQLRKQQELLVSDLVHGIKSVLRQNPPIDNIDNLLTNEIVKYLRAIPMNPEIQMNDNDIERLASELLNTLKALQFFQDISQLERTQHAGSVDNFIKAAIEEWAESLISKEDNYSSSVSKAKGELASKLNNLFKSTDKTTSKKLIEDETSRFLKSIPLDKNKTYDVKVLGDMLFQLINKYEKFTDPYMERAAKQLTDVVSEWCARLSIITDTLNEAENMKEITKQKLNQPIKSLARDPKMFKDDLPSNQLVTEKIDEALEHLNNSNIKHKLPALKRNLLDELEEIRQKINKDFDTIHYRQDLNKTIDDSLPLRELAKDEQAMFEILKNEVADAFINCHYVGGSQTDISKLKQKIDDEIRKFANDYLSKHHTAADFEQLNRELYTALTNVDKPQDASLRNHVEMTKIKYLIQDWIKELPLEELSTKDELLLREMVSSAAKTIQDMENKKEQDANYDLIQNIHDQVNKLIEKLPHPEINTAEVKKSAKALLNKIIKIKDPSTRHSLDTDSFGDETLKKSKLRPCSGTPSCIIPPCAISGKDRAHLERIRKRASLYKQGLESKSINQSQHLGLDEIESQIENQCLGPGKCQGPTTCLGKRPQQNSGMQTASSTMREVSSQAAISPHVIVKEYYWDSIENMPPCASIVNPSCSCSTFTESPSRHSVASFSPPQMHGKRNYIRSQCKISTDFRCPRSPSSIDKRNSQRNKTSEGITNLQEKGSYMVRSPRRSVEFSDSPRYQQRSSQQQLSQGPVPFEPSQSRRRFLSPDLNSSEADVSCSSQNPRTTHHSSCRQASNAVNNCRQFWETCPSNDYESKRNRRCLHSKDIDSCSRRSREKRDSRKDIKRTDSERSCPGPHGLGGEMTNCVKCRGVPHSCYKCRRRVYCPYPNMLYFAP